LLDGNQLAEGKEYFSLRSFEVSDDHKLLAFAADYNGSEQYDIYVKNLETGKMLKDEIKTKRNFLLYNARPGTSSVPIASTQTRCDK